MSEQLVYSHRIGFDCVIPENCVARIESGNVIAIYLPDEKPWNGDGVPPAGITCEVDGSSGKTGFAPCKIIYSSAHVVVFVRAGSPSETTCYVGEHEFRASRTPDQIKAEERQIAIEELGEWLGHNASIPTPHLWEVAQKIYDFGYRKISP